MHKLELTDNQLFKLQLLAGHTVDKDLNRLLRDVPDLITDDDIWQKVSFSVESGSGGLFISNIELPDYKEE